MVQLDQSAREIWQFLAFVKALDSFHTASGLSCRSKNGCCSSARRVRLKASGFRCRKESFAGSANSTHAMHRGINLADRGVSAAISNRPLLAKPV